MANNSIKILVIDDLQDNLITLNALIKDAFPEAITLNALNGKAGLELAAKEDPDVILLDIIMPEMDGYEVCQKLKADKKLSDIPIVFTTALKDTKENRIRALECGGEAFLTKPIDEIELTAQIKAMLKIRDANIQKRDEKERLAELVAQKTRELNKTHISTLNLLEDLKKEIRERKEAEEILKEREYHLSESQRIAHIGSWRWKFAGPINWSDETYRVYGVSPETFVPTIEALTSLIHPEDRMLMQRWIEDCSKNWTPCVGQDFLVLRCQSSGVCHPASFLTDC